MSEESAGRARTARWRAAAGLLTIAIAAGGAYLLHWTRDKEMKEVYAPAREVADDPGRHGLPFEEISFPSLDGVILTGWFLPGPRPGAILWMHGNATTVADYLDRVVPLRRKLGFSILIFDYRGYGSSKGTPGEEGMYRDAEAAMEWLRKRGFGPERTIFYGHSLGSGVAVELATRVRPAGLILEAPFTGIRDRAREVYPYLPAGLLVSARFDNQGKIGKVASPLLVIHGEKDAKIPVDMGKRLFARAGGTKELLLVPEGTHNDCLFKGGEAYFAAWERLSEAAGLPPSPSSP